MPSILARPTVDCLYVTGRKSGQYLIDTEGMTPKAPKEVNLTIPLVIDTEYQTYMNTWELQPQESRFGITTQVKSIYPRSKGVILEHPKVGIKRHPVAKSGFHPVDYLKVIGQDVSIKRVETVPKGLPEVNFVLYAFFALAEALMIVDGAFKEDFKALMRERSKDRPKFEMTRRLLAKTPSKNGFGTDSVKLPWIVTIDGFSYQASVTWVDAGAVHGQVSYKTFCEVCGVNLEAKDLLTQEDKQNMFKTYVEKPEEFDAYALGDLEVYEGLDKNTGNFQKIYQDLGVEAYYTPPKLTIGATVKDLFIAVLKSRLGITPDDKKASEKLHKQFLDPASAASLRSDPSSTKALAAKVEGGRCRNNRPTEVYKKAPIVDLDISGCYGEGQRNQLYFVGKPRVIAYPAGSKFNAYLTLRQFLKSWGKVLVPGGWFARVSTSERLVYQQDFLASWFVKGKAGEDLLAKYVNESHDDQDDENPEFDEEEGSLKIFNHEVLNGTITADFVDWFENICSKRQREELLDKLLIKTAVYYDATERVNSYQELEQSFENHQGKNKVYRKKNANLLSEDGDCHSWLGINIGELLIDDLLANRKVYPKKNSDGTKNPMNELFKLCVNTLYGDMTSKFFRSANVVVGNNITARARATAWYMEKGLNGFQTITDGCAFEVNRVIFSTQGRIYADSLVNLYRVQDLSKLHISLKPLGGYDQVIPDWSTGKLTVTLIKGDQTTVLDADQSMVWVNQACMEHLQMLFPKVAVLHGLSTELKASKDETDKILKTYKDRIGQFSFEAKDWYESGRFHGTSNYVLENPISLPNLKYRAYKTKKYHTSIDSCTYKTSDRYGAVNNPAKDFMEGLIDPTKLKRQEVFFTASMVKPTDYRNRSKTFDALGLEPGDNERRAGLLKEFSLSQFTFQTLDQFVAWKRVYERCKEEQGQSLEDFFINKDGTLNFLEMVKAVDRLVVQGVKHPKDALSKSRHDWKTGKHPAKTAFEFLKETLKTPKADL